MAVKGKLESSAIVQGAIAQGLQHTTPTDYTEKHKAPHECAPRAQS